METLNSIGFTNFWGVTPAYDILNKEYQNLLNDEEINIILTNTNDIRHILKTVSNTFEKISKENSINNKEKLPQINFYFYETFKENLCRSILFFHLIHDRSISIRDRVEIFMEIYGNTLLSSRTADYLNNVYKNLINFVSGDKKYKGPLRNLIDLSQLTYKERDELVEIFSSYDLKIKYDIEKYRDDRLRYMYKERYDNRDNVADWDYQMNLKNFAPIVKLRHYTDFRRSGVSFEMRIIKYNVPNRTLGSYIPGREV
jgi:dynein assembly factor 3, axonemal